MNNRCLYISEIASCIHAQQVAACAGNTGIDKLLTDSRNLSSAEGCLFFALVSPRNDGHKYIEDLYRRGVRNFVVNYLPENLKGAADVNFLIVKDTLAALQQLAATYRNRFSIPVVGITGSNGKTIVKEWLAYLLADDKKIVKSPKSFNSQIGVPLSVWEMQPEHEMAIFEAGISQPGEMERLETIIRPTIGIITNVGTAHDEHFTNRVQKINEKLKLFVEVDLLIYCADHAEIRKQISNNSALNATPSFTWGYAQGNNLQIISVRTERGNTTVEAVFNKEQISISIPFPDQASVENAIHCWAFMLSQDYSQALIAVRMQTLPSIEMRMELKEAINNCSVINDSYSSDFNSLQIAIDFLNHQQQHVKKTVVLSDILQSGRGEDELYADVARLLAAKNIHRLIGIGPVISRQAGKFEMEKSFYPDTETFLRDFPFSAFRDETILLKGARVFAFELIDNALQQKAHETVLEINLNALAHNLNHFRSKLQPGVRVMAMVKAFSYGSGSFEIANLLQYHQVDYLTVAYADEGVELRKAGIRMPIMVMNPEEQSIDNMLGYDLEPEVYSFRILNLLTAKLSNRQKPLKIHIKLDTGMHRLGFEEKDISRLVNKLKELKQPTIKIASIFSHLAASDNAALDWFTQQQIDLFKRMSGQLTEAFDYPILCHILNSAGISRFPEAQFDMVRLGIGLYGIGVNSDEQKQLQNVSTLKTVISQIKHIEAGESVSYNRNYMAERNTTIGVIPIGYADGLNRKFGNGKGRVLVNGKLVAVIGNVCMDMCMIDLTGVDANENDEVIIFGGQHPIQEMSNVLETIPYEILTSISRRVKRVYYQE